MTRFQKWALATTIATYFLIMVGGFVRAAGAGLGCPDWPKCYDRYYPPTSADQVPPEFAADFNVQLAWIEYVNRLIGVFIGLLIIGTMYYAIRKHRDNSRILYPSIAAFILVLFQGWLGGQVVAAELAPIMVTIHLVFALIIVSLLLYATVSGFFPDVKRFTSLPKERKRLGYLVLIVLLLTLIQVGIGANLRGELDTIKDDYPDLARTEWLAEAGTIDTIHRSFSWTLVFGIGGVAYYAHRRMKANAMIQNVAKSLVVLLAIQIGAGIGMAYGGIPPALQVIHLLVASLLVGALTILYMLTNRLPIETDISDTKQSGQQILSQEPALR